MNLLKTTEDHKKYWSERKIDWGKSYLSTYNHPHRTMLMSVLASFPWISLIEVGCGPGPNLVKILTTFKDKQVGGIDISKDAIELARKTFSGGFFKVGSVEDIMMSDNSADVVLSDMALMYVGPRKISLVLDEIKRVARTHVIFCEFHSTSFYARMKLRYTSGYNAYNYKKLLEKKGFYDIELIKIPEESWPGGNPQKTFGFFIKARVPKRK